MDLFEARLASFQAPQPTGKKRASTTKNAKAGKWSLKVPSAEQLAQAGFYLAPVGSGSDNVTCFCCEKSLDGWEEGDNPFREHIHFSKHCAWAILMAIEYCAIEELMIEDPMSEKMLEARRQTYKDQWPHEKRRGWTCKIQKMIEGGWYFSPSPEGDDQANCVYCKKSLFGWEPKDKPYDEHKKRSPDCCFFILSQSRLPIKGRKGRVSKASRTSSQSIATINVDNSLAINQEVDQTQISIMTTDGSMTGNTMKGKKRGGGKKMTAKSAQSKATSMLIDDEAENIEIVSAPPKRATRGKKRTSDQMLEYSLQTDEPPQKRTTRARGSTARGTSRENSQVLADITMEDTETSNIVLSKAAKRGKKRASSTVRKTSSRVASAQSAASQATLRATIPADDEIDAELEADLHRYESDDDSDNWKVLGKDDSVVSQAPVTRSTRVSNIKSSIISAKGKAYDSIIEDRSRDMIMRDSFQVPAEPAVATAIVKKTKAKPGRKAKQTVSSNIGPESRQPKTTDIREFEESLEADDKEHSASIAVVQKVVERDHSNLFKATVADDSGHETDGSILAQNKSKRNSKKVTRPSRSKQTMRKASAKSKSTKNTKEQETAFQIPIEVHDDDVADELHALQAELENQSIQVIQADNLLAPTVDITLDLIDAPTPKGPVSIPRQTLSPEASPQPSDAENQPPSTRPSHTRPPLARYSPTGARTVRIALAPSTPTASSSKRNAMLETTYPWAPADIDYILAGTPAANKENSDLRNLLSIEEKRMSLEEWINWNAKKNEDRLKAECERMVGKFESEGVRALKTLEGIICSD